MTQPQASGLTLAQLRTQYENYASAKEAEIKEAQESSRYRHHAQWTSGQLKILSDRGQPALTFPRIGRKIDGIVGVMRQIRSDPKAFPRTPNEDQKAEFATQIVRYIMDASDFDSVEGDILEWAAFHGIGVAEWVLNPSQAGDYDPRIQWADPRGFFYDPRNLKPDFSECRYKGLAKWVGKDELEELFPGSSTAAQGNDGDFVKSSDSDIERLWQDEKGKIRLVDHWYLQGGKWRYTVHTGSKILTSGDSPFVDQDGNSICKFQAFACAVDHDGDAYSFVRALKGPQDAMNQHKSKAVWIMNTRQVFVRRGAVQDIELLRRQVARPDGVIEYDGDPNDVRVEQPAQEFLQQSRYYDDAKMEIENFGPNPALMGTGVNDMSGRALAMTRQAALAELGPFMRNWRRFKLKQYQIAFQAARMHMTADRWIRVTDDENAQYMRINGVDMSQGFPQAVNRLAEVEADIVMSEGPDTETLMGDVNDTLQAMANNKFPVPPQVVLELSPLPASVKKKISDIIAKPDPNADAMGQAQMAKIGAETSEKQARAAKAAAEAERLGMENELAAMPVMPVQQAMPPYFDGQPPM